MRLLLLALVALQPPFAHSVSRVTAAQLPHSWHAGCPVAPAQLRRVRLTYWGFEGRAHTGALVVNVSLAADNTAAFNCRYVIGPGPKRWSSHAYGLAIDVDPVENPYVEGGRVHPHAGRAYLNRSRIRPGMAYRGGVLVRTLTAVGWQWGGRWTGSPDYQHFSKTGG